MWSAKIEGDPKPIVSDTLLTLLEYLKETGVISSFVTGNRPYATWTSKRIVEIAEDD